MAGSPTQESNKLRPPTWRHLTRILVSVNSLCGFPATAALPVGLTYYIGTQVALEMGVSQTMGEIISAVLGLLFVVIAITIYFLARKKIDIPSSIEEFKEKVMKMDDDETIPEEEWTELRAPLRATGGELKKINKQYHLLLAICLLLMVITAAFTAYLYFL